MWATAMEALAARGLYAHRARSPRLRRLAAAGRRDEHVGGPRRDARELRLDQELEQVALVGHDWGGLIGLRWACDHPDAVWAVVASDTGFFADGRWHGMADALRTPGQGEQLVDGMTRESFGGLLAERQQRDRRARRDRVLQGVRRRAAPARPARALPLGRVREARGPTRAGSRRWACRSWRCGARTTRSRPSRARTGSRARSPALALHIVSGSGHFVFDDAPEETAEALAAFLAGAAPR